MANAIAKKFDLREEFLIKSFAVFNMVEAHGERGARGINENDPASAWSLLILGLRLFVQMNPVFVLTRTRKITDNFFNSSAMFIIMVRFDNKV